MLTVLIRIFIRDRDNTKDLKVREKYGVLCGAYGIFWNILLFLGKYVAGILSASIAMTADAFNNLSDAGSSFISVVGFKMAGKKPDPDHPYGHGRIEYLTGLSVSAIIIVMGYELSKDSIGKIIHPGELTWSLASVIILVLSILVKFYMAFYSGRIGKKIESETLIATSTDSLSDTISTSVVLVTTLIAHFTNIKIDGWCGLLVGILIIIAGIRSANDTISPLLGEAPDKEFVQAVEKIISTFPEIIGMHDLIVHDYGPGRIMISLHAEVPSNGDIIYLHDVIDNAEQKLKNELQCHAVIHMDPVEVGNEHTDNLKTAVTDLVREYDSTMTIHDFRVVLGPSHTNLIFDVVASYSNKKSDAEISKELSRLILDKLPNHNSIICVDRDYSGK